MVSLRRHRSRRPAKRSWSLVHMGRTTLWISRPRDWPKIAGVKASARVWPRGNDGADKPGDLHLNALVGWAGGSRHHHLGVAHEFLHLVAPDQAANGIVVVAPGGRKELAPRRLVERDQGPPGQHVVPASDAGGGRKRPQGSGRQGGHRGATERQAKQEGAWFYHGRKGG